jgi:hypothetical protein
MDRNTKTTPDNWRHLVRGAVAEVDPEQVLMSRHLTSAQRFRQATSMIELSEQVAAYRLRLRHPDLSEVEAVRLIRSRSIDA